MSPHAPISIDRPGGPPLRIELDPARPSITPASRLCLETVDRNPHLLQGRGIDWGSGTGVLAIAAATHPGVEFVLGLELEADEVARARTNAEMNGVADRTAFIQVDLFDPFPSADGSLLDAMRGGTDFLIANPPFDPSGDGLGWRRAVLAGAREFLVPSAHVLLQVSRQYGRRIQRLAADVGGYRYLGLLGSSDWLPFDQDRADLRSALDTYAEVEAATGELYPFRHPTEDREIGAVDALALRDQTGATPRSRWQLHHLVHAG
jgi:predicted RNA methylase